MMLRTTISRLLPSVGVVALVLGVPAYGQDPAPTAAPTQVATATASGDADAWRAAHGRFTERMTELEQDTRAYLDETEESQKQSLSVGYDAVIDDLEDAERTQRQLAIERFDEFLLRYGDSAYASHVRFRLADLYWEQAREDWLANSTEYYALEEQLIAAGREDELQAPPKMDLSRPVSLYERIISDNEGLPKDQQYEFLDGAYYSLGFVYKEDNSEQVDEEKAIAAFQTLIRVRPDSALTDDAHLNLGNFAFENNDFEGAILEYQYIYKRGPESRLYPDAIYQLAWAYYKLDIYDKSRPLDPPEANALGLFAKLLDYSEEEYANSGKRSDYAPDAVKFMAFSFTDMAEDGSRDPTDVAKGYFAKLGPREYEWDVYVALGQALTDYGRFDQAINVYKHLQGDERWRLRPENPEFQMQVVKLYASGAAQDLAASAAARIELTEKYNDDSEWWFANRHNPEALASARRYIEDSLADVAIEYRKNAEADNLPESYVKAAEKFQEYIDKFPISDDYYKMQWYLADTLYRARNYENAATEYTSLLKSKKHHPFGDGSVYQLMRARQQIAELKWGKPDKRPEAAVVERTYTTPGKKEITVYQVAPEYLAFMEAADTVVKYQFAAPTDELAPDLREIIAKNRAAIMYIPAQVLYNHNRFDEARPRLFQLVEQGQCTQEGSFAMSLIVDSYNAEGDLANVSKYTRIYLQKQCAGEEGLTEDQVATFQKTLEGADYLLCYQEAQANAYEAAGDCYLNYRATYPQGEHTKDALFSAANNFDKLGRAERANELYEEYVNQYPGDDRSAGLYFRIAGLYEATFDLEKAVDYYNRLLKNFPKDQFAADAHYNQAFLRLGVGDFAGAAKGFEEYTAKYPDREDGEAVFFMAGEANEKRGTTLAIEFYERYLNKYGMEVPDHALQAERKLAEMYLKKGDTRKSDYWMGRLVTDFDKLVAAGRDGEVGYDGRNAAAESAFRPIQAAFDKLTKDHLGKVEKKNVELLQSKEVDIEAFRKSSLDAIARYGDFEYTTAVLYLRAAALLYYADLGFEYKPPPGLSEDELWAFEDLLQEKVYPKFYALEEKAKGEFQTMTQIAKEKKQHSEWVTKAYETLNQRDPFNFPAQKREVRGGSDSSIVPAIKPLRAEEKKKEEGQ